MQLSNADGTRFAETRRRYLINRLRMDTDIRHNNATGRWSRGTLREGAVSDNRTCRAQSKRVFIN